MAEFNIHGRVSWNLASKGGGSPLAMRGSGGVGSYLVLLMETSIKINAAGG